MAWLVGVLLVRVVRAVDWPLQGGAYVNGGGDCEGAVFMVRVGVHVGLVEPHDVHDKVLYAGDEFAVVGVPLGEGVVEEGNVRVVLLDAGVGLVVGFVVVVAGAGGADAFVDVGLSGMTLDFGHVGGAGVFVE